jgi:hypothetical protein
MHLEPTVEAHAGLIRLDLYMLNPGHSSSFKRRGMVPKSAKRFSDKIMPNQRTGAIWPQGRVIPAF